MDYYDYDYLFDSRNVKSYTGFVFINKGIAISWRSVKQTLIVTFLNYLESLALHEAGPECAC